jgi:2-amino-4-hydroxy-6-hydroxymethyldihydropteridine diphosphokinase
MNKAYLLIGGNVGDTIKTFHEVRELLNIQAGSVVEKSSLYETAPWGKPDQQNFLNQALLILTRLDPRGLIKKILEIEEISGRQRFEKYGPRIIDIDILFFNNSIIDDPEIRIPHPEIQNRRFALVPLAEIAPDLYHPVLKKTITELLSDCPDNLEVSLLT